MEITPELIKAVGDAATNVLTAFGVIAATVASALSAYYTRKNRRDLNIAFDRVRELNGEPPQNRNQTGDRP